MTEDPEVSETTLAYKDGYDHGFTDAFKTAAIIKEARQLLEANGHVVLKAKSYKAAQNRQQAAEMRLTWAEEDRESSRQWAHDCLTQERRLADRCSFLAALAITHGATLDDLRQP